MSRAIQTVMGFGLVLVGVYAFVQLPGRSEWVALLFVGAGGFFISKTATTELLKTGVSTAKELLPWKAK